MKVLIVSFDRNLVKQLRNALGEYEVMDVKNAEEALNLAIAHFDVIITTEYREPSPKKI
jgi:phage gp36-like protein